MYVISSLYLIFYTYRKITNYPGIYYKGVGIRRRGDCKGPSGICLYIGYKINSL